jgi:DNA modification methylase
MIDAPSYIHESLAGLSVPIDSLNLDAANVRTHDDRNLDAIARSLDRWGQRQPIVVQREGMIVRAGNGRILAAKRLGWDQIAALIVDENSVEATAYAIADNRTGELAGWDDEGLVAMLQSMPDDLPDIGFSDRDLEQLIADLTPAVEIKEDEAPEPPADPVTRPGDLWTLGRHRVLCGDSTSGADVRRLMPDGAPSLLFTSPPYLDQREYSGNDLSLETLLGFMDAAHDAGTRWACVNLGIARKDGLWITYWDDYIARAKSLGWGIVSWNVWDRSKAHSVGQQTAAFGIEHEWVFVFGEEAPRLVPTIENKCAGGRQGQTIRNSAGQIERHKDRPPIRERRQMGTVARIDPVSDNFRHPAQYPVALPGEYLKAFDLDAYDPFLGSGTTLIAAEQLGRTCYGMEISPAYCDVIVRRWEALTGSRAARVDSEGNEAGPMPEPQEAAVAAGV